MPQDIVRAKASPALVTQKSVQPLPRWALLLLCAAYVLPGVFGRDPWKNADMASFGQMWSLALGDASWFNLHIGGVAPTSGGVLPYWLGGAFIWLTHGWLEPALAARIPFALVLALVLALTWYATYHLAQTESARPLPLAFGGEAQPKDYARAMADGALLALIATLGLLQMGHETTPELLQLLGAAGFLYGLAALDQHPRQAAWAAVISLPILASSGSPTVAQILGCMGLLVCWRSQHPHRRHHMAFILLAMVLAAATILTLMALDSGRWTWKLSGSWSVVEFLELVLWFTWPALPLAVLTWWHWRRQLPRRHMAVPTLMFAAIALASWLMGSDQQALLMALPALAVLASFALPILLRGLGAAIDWFSVLFFSLAALLIWVAYSAMHTGTPQRLAANLAKRVPGYEAEFSVLALVLAALGTLAWLALVRWRTARRSHALWKSLVLPASGVTLVWLLLLTLFLPVLDQGRSHRLLIERLGSQLPRGAEVCAPGAPAAIVTALAYFGEHRVDGRPSALDGRPSCRWLVQRLPAQGIAKPIPGWTRQGIFNQRTRNSEKLVLYRRASAP